ERAAEPSRSTATVAQRHDRGNTGSSAVSAARTQASAHSEDAAARRERGIERTLNSICRGC
ncbi:MAG TPA: hypothetical protein VHG27_07095, partial [Xanthobacteraceae bacterium]|nr:hypothetical protein [Xanthobacteraceae bacterium]